MTFLLSVIYIARPKDMDNTFVCIKLMKPVFCYLKRESFLQIWKSNISGSVLNEGLVTDTTFDPC